MKIVFTKVPRDKDEIYNEGTKPENFTDYSKDEKGNTIENNFSNNYEIIKDKNIELHVENKNSSIVSSNENTNESVVPEGKKYNIGTNPNANIKTVLSEDKNSEEEKQVIYPKPFNITKKDYVELDNKIEGEPSNKIKEVKKSNIDGSTEFTNTQDGNFGSLKDSNSWKEMLKGIGGSVLNSIGVTNTEINNLVSSFKSFEKDDNMSSFDYSMAKLDNWKKESYKDMHPFDWKPGQTIPKDLMKSSVATLAKDTIDTFGSKENKNLFNDISKMVSPDPIKYVRDSIGPNKGIFSDSEVAPDEFATIENNFAPSYSLDNKSAVISSWKKSKKFSSFNKSPDEMKFINALKNRNTFNKKIGYIYIKPNYDYSYDNSSDMKEGQFQIPFEFNPEISEGSTQANYVSETLLNRIGQFQVYTGTNLSQLSINLKYITLAPDELDKEMDDKIAKQFSTDAWQYYWTNNRIEEIEYKLRSLVMPDVTSTDYLIRPPMIEIHFGNNSGSSVDTVGDLFKYPIGIDSSKKEDDQKYLSVTRSISDSKKIDRYKKYIVTSVQIDNINEDNFVWPSLYGRVWDNEKSGSPINHIKTKQDIVNLSLPKGEEAKAIEDPGYSGYVRRTGFKATLQCIEVTENFLDIVPDFRSYYNAWMYKEKMANYTSNYTDSIMSSELKTTTDTLDATISSALSGKDLIKEKLNSYFDMARVYASLYKSSQDQSTELYKFNNSLDKDNISEDNKYYFIGNWSGFDKESKENNKNILFNIKLPLSIGNFLYKIPNINMQDVYDLKEEENYIDLPDKESLSKIDKEALYGKSKNNDIYGLSEGPLSYANLKSEKEKNFTDYECSIIKSKLILKAREIKNESYNIDNPNSFTLNKVLHEFLKIIDMSRNGKRHGNTWKESYNKKELSINILNLEKENKELFNIYFGRSSLLKEDSNLIMDTNYLALLNSVNETTYYYENFIKPNLLDEYNLLQVDNYIKKNQILYLLKLDILHGNTNEGKKFFDTLKNILKEFSSAFKKDETHNPDNSIKFATDNVFNNYYKTVYNNIKNGIDKVYSTFDNYYECLKELGDHLSSLFILGGNLKKIVLEEKEKNFTYKSSEANSTEKRIKYTLKRYTLKRYNNIKLLGANDIEKAMIKSFNNARESLNDLKKELDLVKIGNYTLSFLIYFINLNNINFKFLKYDEDEDPNNININFKGQEYENDYKNNVKAREDMCTAINNLKKVLSREEIQNLFTKISGNYENNNIKSEIIGLKSLKEKNEYDKKDNLKEKVFKDWEEIESLDKANALVSSKNFEEAFKDDENGMIPHEYYNMYNANKNIKLMQVAGNSINNFNKLT